MVRRGRLLPGAFGSSCRGSCLCGRLPLMPGQEQGGPERAPETQHPPARPLAHLCTRAGHLGALVEGEAACACGWECACVCR